MQQRAERQARWDARSVLPVLFVLAAALALAIALFGNGYHYGLYNDDYAHKRWAYDLDAGTWRPTLEPDQDYFRPLGLIVVANLANALPQAELPVRVLWAAVHLANVILVAWLAYRLVPSPLLAVIAGGVMLFPFQAHEALFWHSGAAGAGLGTLVALGAVHLLLSAIERETAWIWPAVLGLALVGLIPQFYEQAAMVLLCLPFLALFLRPVSGRRILRLLLILVVAAGLLVAHWFLVLSHSAAFESRGGVQPSLYYLFSEGFPRLYEALVWSSFERYELVGFAAAWYLGRESLSHNLGLLAVLALLGAAGAATILLASDQEEDPPRVRAYLSVVGVGCLWVMTAFVPVLLVTGHVVDSRVLYFPWVGLALALGATIALLVTRLPARLRNIAVMLAGLVVLLQVVDLAGFGQVYRLRSQYDQKQLSALTASVPRLPEGEFYLVPLNLDERSVSAAVPGYDALDWWLLGVFENTWSAGSAVAMRYGRTGIVPVTSSRWDKLTIDGVKWQAGEPYLLINGQLLPAQRCLVFSYQGEQVTLFDSVLVEGTGVSSAQVALPLAREVGSDQARYDQITVGTEEGE